MKILQNVYEGLISSHVKFDHNLPAGLKKLPRKPRNFGDNWPLTSISLKSKYILTINSYVAINT